ncbi:MAG: ABC transporter permease [Oscillospiraceae bacterium]|nr:ABC transporter permease [Oscillospiraceae bacterium]
MTQVISNSWTMTKRCLKTSLRNPDNIAAAIFIPAIVMALFGLLFKNVINVGDYNYIDFIVPGIILQTVAQAVTGVAISVNNDMKKGMNDRFRSMHISKSSVLTGHVLSAIVRNMIATAVVIGVAFILGFRPQAGFTEWLIIAGLLILYMLGVTWIAVICGIIAKSPEAAGTMPFLLFVLPYISSGFVPVETMPNVLRQFAENQPMTPIVDSLRALTLGLPIGDNLTLALFWSVLIIAVTFVIAVGLYKKKT